MDVRDFRQRMTDLHADTYSLTNDIEITYDKANFLVYRLMQLIDCGNDANVWKAIVNEYKAQVSQRISHTIKCYDIEGDNLF